MVFVPGELTGWTFVLPDWAGCFMLERAIDSPDPTVKRGRPGSRISLETTARPGGERTFGVLELGPLQRILQLHDGLPQNRSQRHSSVATPEQREQPFKTVSP